MADTRWGTGHSDSVGWDRAVGPGGDKSDPASPASHPSPFLSGSLPACCHRSAPCTPALGSPDATGQHHSPAPRPPTPRPPTPRPPTPRPPKMGSPGEHQRGRAAGQRLICSSPSPMCACPSSGSPTPSMPWGSIPLPASQSRDALCLHMPAACAQLLPVPTWDGADPWDSNPGNTCQRETINPCPLAARHHQLGAPPASARPTGVVLTPILGGPSTHLTAPRARRPRGSSPPA